VLCIVGYGTGAGLSRRNGAFDYALVNQFRYNIRVITNSFGTNDIGTNGRPGRPISPWLPKRCVDRNIVVVFSAEAGSLGHRQESPCG
jgi:serine protease AprX